MEKAELLGKISMYQNQIQEVTEWRNTEFQQLSNQLKELQDHYENLINEQEKRKRRIKRKLDEISQLKEKISDLTPENGYFRISQTKNVAL